VIAILFTLFVAVIVVGLIFHVSGGTALVIVLVAVAGLWAAGKKYGKTRRITRTGAFWSNICPHCGKHVKPAASVCFHCGNALVVTREDRKPDPTGIPR
jgi:hypothetical protein